MIRHLNTYRIAIFLASSSMVFGLLREFLIVGLLGFTINNDQLQLYLSIFYTIGMTIDAMRLSCLNLYNSLSLPQMIFSASIIALPYSCLVGLAMSYSTNGINIQILIIAIVGSYLNLIAALLITYKQRNDMFLTAQVINVLPNFVLIPGILLCYWYFKSNIIFSIVLLTSIIPVAQCTLLFILPNQPAASVERNNITFISSSFTFIRHFAVMTGEQIYQIITRKAFYHYGTGYLSLFAMAIRIYSAARFILVDSFIGSKLANWESTLENEDTYFSKLINSTFTGILIVALSFLISLHTSENLLYSCVKVIILLMFGFYLSTLVRILYFKINHHQSNSGLITRFGFFELLCAVFAFVLTKQMNYSILTLLWIGYIAKPFGQLLLLRKHYHGMALNYGMNGT